jgi:hypothetical protein
MTIELKWLVKIERGKRLLPIQPIEYKTMKSSPSIKAANS